VTQVYIVRLCNPHVTMISAVFCYLMDIFNCLYVWAFYVA